MGDVVDRIRVGRGEALALIGLTLAAAALRLWHLGSLPPGLHVDEAFNILDARAVLAGWQPVFLPANAGREVLYTYWQALLLGLGGESAATARLASALIGVLTVPATWAFVRRLPVARPARVALLAAAFTAFSYWHLHFSRFGIRAVLFPLVVTGVIWTWWELVRPMRQAAVSVGKGEFGGAPAGMMTAEIVGERGADSDRGGTGDGEGGTDAVWAGAGRADVGRADAGRTDPGRKRQLAVFGPLLGLAVYAHPVGRALALVPAAHAAYRWLRWRDGRPARLLALALAGALVVALPVVVFWLRQPWLFTSHAGETSILAAGPTAVAVNLAKVLAMFNLAGDPAAWRNLAGRPVFDVLTGVLFLLGLANAADGARRGSDGSALLLIWFAVLLLPTVVTDAAPNFSRAIGVLPVVFVFPAIGLDRLADLVATRLGARLTLTLVAGCLAFSAARTTHDYFRVWATDPDTPLAFDDDKVALARYVDRQARDGSAVYLSKQLADHATVRVLTAAPPAGFYPAYGLVLPPADRTQAQYAYLPWETDVAAALVGRFTRAGVEVGATPTTLPGIAGDAHQAIVFALPKATRQELMGAELAGTTPTGQTPRRAVTFGSQIRLLRADLPAVVRAGEVVTVTLVWECLAPTAIDMNTAVHLATLGGAGITQGDGPPLGGSYPTDRWRDGEVILADYALDVPANAAVGPVEIRVGWYDWRTTEPLTTDDGQVLVTVGTLGVVR